MKKKFILTYLKSRETENYLKIEKNLYKYTPKNDNKLIKIRIFGNLKTLINDEKL